jgi:homoserine O-acetyltransferase
LEFFHNFFTPKNDANNLLTMLDTWQRADISNHIKFDGDLNTALSAITSKAIVMPGRTDMYFPPEDNETEVIMMPNAELRVIESIYGHGAGGPGFSTQDDDDFIDHALMKLLGHT